MKAVYRTVIIEPFYKKEISGIVIPEKYQKANSEHYGKVIHVGPDCKYGLVEGDTVLLSRDEGIPVDEKLVLKEEHILARIS